MSYCVHCGVQLNDHATACPLCHTPVVDPSRLELPTTSPFFPTKPAYVPPVSRNEAALLLTAMLASAAAACAVLNLFLKPGTGWSMYVALAAVMLWIWFVPLLMFPKMPFVLREAIDLLAIAGYVYFIAVRLNGVQWFVGIALPILILVDILSCILGYLFKVRHTSLISSISFVLGAVALLCLGIEATLDLYFDALWRPGWSIVIATICVAVMVPLVIVRRVPSLREEARRRFHL